MPKKSEQSIGTEQHHCSQCNRSSNHLLYDHPDGLELECSNCKYRFLDIRTETPVSKVVSKPETVGKVDANES